MALRILLGGLFYSFSSLFGGDGFIENTFGNDALEGGKKFGAAIGLLLGLPISIATVWLLFSVIKRRADQAWEQEFTFLIDYFPNRFLPRVIIIFGEVIFILMLYSGLIMILAGLLGSPIYMPLSAISSPLMMALFDIPITGDVLMGLAEGVSVSSAGSPFIPGGFDDIGELVAGGIGTLFSSFLILVIFYIYKEVYLYLLLLITNLISFLPRFAFPLAIRYTGEKSTVVDNRSIRQRIEDKDI